MKKQRITKLIIRNFRGIEYQEFNFYNDDLNNSICNPIKTGKNGTGKTTVLDSISYLYNNKKHFK
ncbi:AAA family ATPase [Mycoplasmopsis cynos]|nr:AAA family ATPase [Mycoplasmopsis cynos]